MATADPEGPLPGDLILHTCNGIVRWWRPAGSGMACRCGAPLAGDLPPLMGHAQGFCDHCHRWVGACASVELAEVAEGAHRILVAAGRNRRRNEEGQ